MNSTKNFFALAAALLIPVVTDGALIAEAAQAVPEFLITKSKSTEEEELGIDDIELLTEEVGKAAEAGNYQKAINILGGSGL